MVLDFSVYAHSRWTCVNHFLLILRNLVNHYVANPFTIHQRLYIYIFISPATISHTVLPVLPEEKTTPDDSTDSHTERTLTHRITYRGTCLSFLQRMYDTPYDCTDLRLSKFSLRSFFQCSHARSFFHVDFPDTIRYDTITIDLCIAMGNYIESYPHRPEHSLLTACSITEKYQSP